MDTQPEGRQVPAGQASGATPATRTGGRRSAGSSASSAPARNSGSTITASTGAAASSSWTAAYWACATEAARNSAGVLAVNERSHGVWMAFTEASRNDEVLTAELRRLTEEIAEQTRIAVEQWRTQGWLREDLPVAELVRRAAAIGSVELWDRLVRVEGHTPAAYRELIAGLLLEALTTVRAGADEFPVAERSH